MKCFNFRAGATAATATVATTVAIAAIVAAAIVAVAIATSYSTFVVMLRISGDIIGPELAEISGLL